MTANRHPTEGPVDPAATHPDPSGTARRLAEIGVLATVVIWSANFALVKGAIGVIGPLTFSSARFLVAAITLLAILRWRQGHVMPGARQLPILLGLGALGFGGYQILWTIGLTGITAGDSALIVAAAPVLTAVLAAMVGLDRLTAPKGVGALIAFAGVAIVIVAGDDLGLGSSLLGDLLTLAASFLWAIYTLGGTRVLRTVDPLQATAWTVTGGALVLLPIGLIEAATGPWPVVGPGVILAVLVSGSLAAGISNVFMFNAIRFIGPTRATAMTLLVPAGAVVLGAVFLAEPIGAAQVVGGVVIVLGVWLTRQMSILPARRPARPVMVRR